MRWLNVTSFWILLDPMYDVYDVLNLSCCTLCVALKCNLILLLFREQRPTQINLEAAYSNS
jgi:hypothetical protein